MGKRKLQEITGLNEEQRIAAVIARKEQEEKRRTENEAKVLKQMAAAILSTPFFVTKDQTGKLVRVPVRPEANRT